MGRFSGRTLIAIFLVLGIAGGVTAYYTYDRVRKEASLDLKISRAEAERKAVALLAARGVDTGRFQQAISFSYDNFALLYMERELGIERANEIIARDLRFWHWETRFFVPLEKEEYLVRLDTAGTPIGWTHEIPENAPGAKLSSDKALVVARSYLAEHFAYPLEDYDLVEQESTEKNARVDHAMAWERSGYEVADAPVRLEVDVSGDVVTRVYTRLDIPENWIREFLRQRSYNWMLSSLADAAALPLLAILFVFIVSQLGTGNIRWRPALILGGATCLIVFAVRLNSIPLALRYYDTTQSYASFIARQILSSLLGSLYRGVIVAAIYAGAEIWFRNMLPEKLSLDGVLRLHGWRGAQTGENVIVGYSVAALGMGYVSVFYLVADWIGAWSPPEVSYTDALTTYAPWLYAVLSGFSAAAIEEGIFRVFAVSYLLKKTHSRIVAVVLPAVIWAFLHCNYPQQPFYIRGLEIVPVGIVAGLIFLRYGPLASFLCHYTFNCFLTLHFFLRCGHSSIWIPGAIVLGVFLVPLGFSLATVIRRRGTGGADDDLLNAASPVREEPPAAPVHFPSIRPAFLSRARLAVLAGLAVAAGGAAWFLRTPGFADDLGLEISRRAALEAADASLRESLGRDPSSYHCTAVWRTRQNRYAQAYVYRRDGFAAADRVFTEEFPDRYGWEVRYFRLGEKEEFCIRISPSGDTLAIRHRIDDEEERPTPTDAQARAKAEEYFREVQGLDLSAYRFFSAQQRKHPNRTDAVIKFRKKHPDWGDAYIYVAALVAGEEILAFQRGFHVPEEWIRRENESHVGNAIATHLMWAVPYAAVLLALLGVGRMWHRRLIPWRPVLALTAVIVALEGLEILNRLPQQFFWYPTATAYTNHFVTFAAESAGRLLLSGLTCAALLALAWGAYRERFQGEPRLGPPATSPAERRRYWLDVLARSYLLVPVVAGLAALEQQAIVHFPTLVRDVSSEVPAGLSAVVPPLDGITEALTSALFFPAAVMAACFLATQYIRRRYLTVLIVVALCVAQPLTDARPVDAAVFAIGRNLLAIAALAAAVFLVLRRTVLAYAFAAFALVCLKEATALMASSGIWGVYAWLFLALAFLPAAYALYSIAAARRKQQASSPDT